VSATDEATAPAAVRAAGRHRLTGRAALVTGGTSGIGRAIVAGLAAEGARVTVTGRNAERGRAVVRDVEAGGGEAVYLPGDITNVADCDRVVAETIERFGKLDVLVNSAGVFPLAHSHEVSEKEFDRAIDVNLKGAFFCGQAAIRHMLDRGQGGKIINMASIAGLIGIPNAAVYCATKGAMVSLTQGWAVEYAARGILVNAIAPGNIETPMNDSLMADPDYRAKMIANTPAGRNGQPRDVVPAVVMLASDEGDYFCGATLVIDGGWTAR
jgi:glucose 1-dehydrogenase